MELYSHIDAGAIQESGVNLGQRYKGQVFLSGSPDEYTTTDGKRWVKEVDNGPEPTRDEIVDSRTISMIGDVPTASYSYTNKIHTQDTLMNEAERLREQVVQDGPTYDAGGDRIINPRADTRTLIFFEILKDDAVADSEFVYPGYRARNGVFDLTASEIIAIHGAGKLLIATAFNVFNSIESAILAGTITTFAQIKAAYVAQGLINE